MVSMSNPPPPSPIRKLDFSMFSKIFSDKMTALEYAFIVFSKKKSPFFGVYLLFIHR